MFEDLSAAIDRMAKAALALAQLAEELEPQQTDGAKRAGLIGVAVSAGEFIDRLRAAKLKLWPPAEVHR